MVDSAAILDDGDRTTPGPTPWRWSSRRSRRSRQHGRVFRCPQIGGRGGLGPAGFRDPSRPQGDAARLGRLDAPVRPRGSTVPCWGPPTGSAIRYTRSIPRSRAPMRSSPPTSWPAFTGGTAMAPLDNRFLKAAAQETGSYYWLGFTPSWKANDRTHQVSVTVQGSGLAVRSRHGFSDLSKASEAALRTESVLLFGGAEPDKRLVVQLGTPKRDGREVEVPVTLGVPFESLVMTPRGRGLHGGGPAEPRGDRREGGAHQPAHPPEGQPWRPFPRPATTSASRPSSASTTWRSGWSSPSPTRRPAGRSGATPTSNGASSVLSPGEDVRSSSPRVISPPSRPFGPASPLLSMDFRS